jgi:cytochrome c
MFDRESWFMRRQAVIGLFVAASVIGAFSGAGVTATVGGVQETHLYPSDAQEGRTVFVQVCGTCHANEPDKHKVGPSLFGVVGRQAGSVPGFDYSDAMKAASLAWNDDTLDRYLADPKNFVRGNRMPYSLLMGVKNGDRRKGVIAYLHTLQ